MHFVEHGSDTETPDLMVVDINLPSYTGLEILQRLRQQTWLSETPVAILTTSDSKIERDQAERLGISCYLRKPPELFDFIALGAVLKRCVGAAL
jgi:CheY-like chemotaxis protein